jgi:hypothetical protein
MKVKKMEINFNLKAKAMKTLPQRYRIIIITFIFLINIEYISAQVVKMKTTSYSYKYKENDLKWTNWADFEESSVLVSLDPDKSRITVFSKKTQAFDILESEGKTTDDEGDDFYSFFCRNEKGEKCSLRLAILHSRGGRSQLYINYDDLRVVFNLKNLN